MNRKKIITIFVIVIVLAGSAAYFGWTLLSNSRSSRADADNTVTLSLQSSTNVASVNDEFIVKVIATQQAANTISLLQAQVRYTTNTLKLVGFDDIANGCNNLKYLQPNTITPPTAAVFTIAKVADIDAQTVTFPTGNFCFSALRFKRIAHATDTNASITLEPIIGAPGVSGTGGQVPLVVDAQKKQVSVAAVRSFNKLTVQAIISTSPVALGAFKVRYSCVAVGATPTSTVTLTRTPTPTPVPCIPTLTTPQNASTFTGANPTFVWSSCAGAGVRYKLDVFAGTTTTPFKSVIQTATSYAFTGQQLPVWVRNTVYSWKVKKCIDTDCVGGTYSTTHTFTYNPPLDVPTATTAPTATLTPTRTPTPTATTAPTRTPTPAACLTLNQTCVSAAGAATGTCCTSLRCTTKDLSGSAEKICKALSSGGGGGGGQLPDVVTVTVAPTATRTPTPVPCIPTLTTPPNASTFTGTNPTFVWSTCAGVGVRYKLDVFAGTSTTPFKSVIQSATSYAFTGQQLPVWVRGTVYSWKVKKCIDTDCVGGTYSATRTFTYNPPLDVPTATSIPTRTPTPTILAACLMLNQACENISGTSLGTCCAGMSCQSTALGSMVDKTCQATTVAASTATPTVTPRVQPNGGNLTLISAETDGVAAQSGIIDFTSPSTLSKTLNFAGQQVSCSIVTTTDSGEVSGPSLASFPGGSYWVSEKSMSQSATGDMNVTLTYRVVTPDAPAPTPTPTVQPDDENGTPTPTPTRSAAGSPTPTPVLDDGVDPDKVTLRMKVKLQGVNAATFSSQYNRLTFSVAVGGGTLTENTPFISSVFSSRGGGVYEGQVAFERQRVPSGAEYKLLVKGPKHLARRFCMANPSGGFNYFCAEEAGKITLRQGLNTFDFSKVNLLAGDLPIDNAQDGVIDSSDLTIVRQYLGNKQPDVIKVADVNLDGIVDTQDYILIISNTLANEDEQ